VNPVQFHEIPRDAKGFLLRVRLEYRPATDDFLGFGEGTIGHRHDVLRETYAKAVLTWKQASRIDERTVLQRFARELAHRFHECRRRSSLSEGFGSTDEGKVFHEVPLVMRQPL